jgi:hypothetical protein
MPIELEDQDCSLCRFFIPGVNDLTGECHRHPPRIMNHHDRERDMPANSAHWPAVGVFGWCGEFTERSETNG